MKPKIHRSGIYPMLVDVDCPACGQLAPARITQNPYITTHNLREGGECIASRTFISRETVDARVAEINAQGAA